MSCNFVINVILAPTKDNLHLIPFTVGAATDAIYNNGDVYVSESYGLVKYQP